MDGTTNVKLTYNQHLQQHLQSYFSKMPQNFGVLAYVED